MAKDDADPSPKIAFRYATQDKSLRKRLEARIEEKDIPENRSEGIRQVLNDLLNTADSLGKADIRDKLDSIQGGVESIQLQLGDEASKRREEEVLEWLGSIAGKLEALQTNVAEATMNTPQRSDLERTRAELLKLNKDLHNSLRKAVAVFVTAVTKDDTKKAIKLAEEMFPEN